MKNILYICVIIFLSSIHLFGQWRIIDTKTDTLIVDICFPDTSNGWAITSETIIHSSDGGETWEVQKYSLDSVDFWKITFVNEKVGYIVGYDGLILATKDGGNNWVKQNSGRENFYLLRDICFVDENNGWIVGLIDDATTRGGAILNTTDGGNTWLTQVERRDGIGYYALNFLDINNGWALSSYGWDNYDDTYVNRTYDGGKNWDSIGTIRGIPSFVISMTSVDTIWTGGFGYSRSFNGGVDWNDNSFIQNFPGDTTFTFPIIFVDILKINKNDGLAIISRLRSGNKYIPLLYSTKDAGLHWDFASIPNDFIPSSLTNIGNTIYISGKKGLVLTNKNPSVIKETTSTLNFELFQNYPNPFNPSTSITYELRNEVNVKLIIFDALGRWIKNLVNENHKSGVYCINWNGVDDHGAQVPSGVYFIQLIILNKSLIKKAVLIH